MATYTYDDFRVTLTAGAAGDYDARVIDPTGAVHVGVFRLPITEAELERAIVSFARGGTRKALPHSAVADAPVVAAGGPSRDVGADEAPDLDAERIGAALAGALLAGEIGVQFQLARRRAAAGGRGLRLTLSLAEAPELLSLPWEFLYVRPRFLASQRRSPLVRHLAADSLPAPPSIDRTVRILGVVASPLDLTPLDVGAERTRVEQAVAKVVAMGRVELDWLEPATPRCLRQTLRDGNYDILHYVGHSDFTADGLGTLFLETATGRAEPIDETELANLLSDQARLRLVVLNSCDGARTTVTDPYAGLATTLVHLGVPAVVAMQFQISDAAAILFAEELYTNLIGRQAPIDAAVAEARKAIYIEMGNLEWATPVLFMGDPEVELFRFEVPAAAPSPQRSVPAVTDGDDPVPVPSAAAEAGSERTAKGTPWRPVGRTGWGLLAAAASLLVAIAVFAWPNDDGSSPGPGVEPTVESGSDRLVTSPTMVISPDSGRAGTTIEVHGDACPDPPDGKRLEGVSYWLDSWPKPDAVDTWVQDEVKNALDQPWSGTLVVPDGLDPGAQYWVGAACWSVDAAGERGNSFEYPNVDVALTE